MNSSLRARALRPDHPQICIGNGCSYHWSWIGTARRLTLAARVRNSGACGYAVADP